MNAAFRKRSRGILSLAVCLALAGGWVVAQAQKPKDAGSKPRELSVLFIGNSYTWFNNLPHLVEALAKSAHEPRLRTRMVVGPGATLKSHWDAGAALEAVQSEKWDYVILQDQSSLGLPVTVSKGKGQFNPRLFHEFARRFDAAIRPTGAKTLFFLTWARADSLEDQDGLTEAYRQIATELADGIAPVGLAWKTALEERPALLLHQGDLSHPSPAGSYLAACVLYSVLYGKSSEGLTARISADAASIPDRAMTVNQPGGLVQLSGVNLPPADARFLQTVAWRVAQAEAAATHVIMRE